MGTLLGLLSMTACGSPAPGAEDHRDAVVALNEGGRVRLSDIVRARVEDGDGVDLGRVTEIHAAPATAPDGTPGLRLVSLTYGRHLVGNGLGYRDQSHAGPLALATLVRWWHRHERVTSWDDVLTLPGPGSEDDPVRVVGGHRPTRAAASSD